MPKNLIENDAAITASCKLLSAMKSPKRFRVLAILSKVEMSVGKLALELKVSQPVMSQLLAALWDDGFLTAWRDGLTVFYSCQSSAVHSHLRTIDAIIPIKRSISRVA